MQLTETLATNTLAPTTLVATTTLATTLTIATDAHSSYAPARLGRRKRNGININAQLMAMARDQPDPEDVQLSKKTTNMVINWEVRACTPQPQAVHAAASSASAAVKIEPVKLEPADGPAAVTAAVPGDAQRTAPSSSTADIDADAHAARLDVPLEPHLVLYYVDPSTGARKLIRQLRA